MKNEIIDVNKEYREELIKRINECSSVNKNCDYLLEHDEIDELMEYIKGLENKWNKLKEKIESRIKSYEDREKLGKGYELTEVMQISLACDRRFLETMQEMEKCERK